WRHSVASRTPLVLSDYGLPYSKGLMAQSIMATGLAPERSFALAAEIERRLTGAGTPAVGVDDLRAVAEEVLAEKEDAEVVARFRHWWRLRALDRPLLVLIGGVTGVGKSTGPSSRTTSCRPSTTRPSTSRAPYGPTATTSPARWPDSCARPTISRRASTR